MHEQVQPTVDLERRVAVEVCVDGELATGPDLMLSASEEVRVRDEACDAGDAFQQREEGSRVEFAQEIPGRRTERAPGAVGRLHLHGQASLDRHVGGIRELVDDGVQPSLG